MLIDTLPRSRFIRERIASSLNHTLNQAEILELGMGKKGKVRHIYQKKISEKEHLLIMPTSDRVSCFDIILKRAIPFKGIVLNKLASWSFEQVSDIIPHALLTSPHPHLIVQKKMLNLGIECVVRGYVWGSLAKEYEEGVREKSGNILDEGLLRYQKLIFPLFTPATKAEAGEHDLDISLEEMGKIIQDNLIHAGIIVNGLELAQKVRTISFRLYQRGDELARKVGLSLIDTKYEFGVDQQGNLFLIDEIHTPDSSRYLELSDWNIKWETIREKMQNRCWNNVTHLLQDNPELKVKELSKQLVRDVLLENGFDPYSGEIPTLTDEEVIETSARYIELYERLTGTEFNFSVYEEITLPKITQELITHNLAKPYIAVIMAGSGSDEKHLRIIYDELQKWGIPTTIRIISAHKQGAKLEQELSLLNQRKYAAVIISVAGGIDALSGTASYHSIWPVISCPPDGQNNLTVLGNPHGSSNSVIYSPINAAKHVAQIFAVHDESLRKRLLESVQEKINKLEESDTHARECRGIFKDYF